MATPTEQDVYATPSAFTITLASLASGASRQATLINNTAASPATLISFKIKLGTSPTAGGITFYLLRNNATNSIADDSVGASDAGITINYAPSVCYVATKASPATGDTLTGSFILRDLGPSWTIAINNGTGVALDATGSNHVVAHADLNYQFPSI